jgi:hypothetical protein
MHPFAEGVIVKVTVTGTFVAFDRLPLIFPFPLFNIEPVIEGLSLVHV